MENRHGLCVDVSVARATGSAEREEALRMVRRQRANGIAAKTLGADKAYDTADFVTALRTEGITPHVAEHITMYRGSTLDCRTTRHPGYALSQRARKRIEEISAGAKRSAAGGRAGTAGSNATASGRTSWRRPTTWSA